MPAASAKALRHIPELCGKAYAPGDPIPAAAIAKITPQVLRVLVDQHSIEVEGMEPSGKGSGGMQHLIARIDRQGEQIKAMETARAEDAKTISALGKRLDALEDVKPTKAAKPAKAK